MVWVAGRTQRGEGEREEAKGPLPEVGPLSAGELDAMAQRLLALQQQRELNGGM